MAKVLKLATTTDCIQTRVAIAIMIEIHNGKAREEGGNKVKENNANGGNYKTLKSTREGCVERKRNVGAIQPPRYIGGIIVVATNIETLHNSHLLSLKRSWLLNATFASCVHALLPLELP